MTKVAVIMGSESDWPIMSAAVEILKEFSVDTQSKVISAHRMPEETTAYARAAKELGVSVIIAGAGGAAHLPGVVASFTTLPVIGVPIKLENSLDGMDSLLSIVQMPSGVPVATVAINGAKNAGILAAEILALQYPEIAKKLEDYRETMRIKAGNTNIG